MTKHLLSDLKLEKLSQLDELNDTAQEELDDLTAETTNVMVDEPPQSAESLPPNI